MSKKKTKTKQKKSAIELNDEEISRIQKQKKRERVERVSEGIANLLERENCRLEPKMTFSYRGITPQIDIIAN